MRLPVLGLAVLALVAPPAGLAGTAQGSVATGETDTYNVLVYVGCEAAVVEWTVTLSLVDPTPGDVVLLTLTLPGSIAPPPVAASLATYDQPVVILSYASPSNCPPLISVSGVLVAESVGYVLTWQW